LTKQHTPDRKWHQT